MLNAKRWLPWVALSVGWNAVFGTTSAAQARTGPTLVPGDRVRSTLRSARGERTAHVVSLSSDTLVLQSDGAGTQAVSAGSIAALSVARARTSGQGAWRGAKIGFITGALLTAAATAIV